MMILTALITTISTALANIESHFDTGQYKPNNSLVERVKQLCTQIEPEAKIIIEGHTDTRGSEAYNLKLSKKRAEAVKTLIEQCGVSSENIKAIPMGEFFPVSDKHDENRRVEVHLIQSKPKTIIITDTQTIEKESNPDTIPIIVDIPVEPNLIETKKEVYFDWHVTGFVANGHYDLDTYQSNSKASAELNRSWTGGVMIERRIRDSWYLGGGATLDGQFLMGVGRGF